MRKLTIEVYTFSELSKEAKETAIENTRNHDGYLDYEWYDGVYYDATAIAALMGIDIKKIHFSGFYSQGDGAMFIGGYEYNKNAVTLVKDYAPKDTELHGIAERLTRLQRRYFYQLKADVKHYGRYYHENSNTVDVYTNDDRRLSDSIENDLTECLRDFMRWIYKQLENTYDYLNSNEAIAEHLTINDYEFQADGNRY